MSEHETAAERYVSSVLDHLPAAIPQQDAVARDLRASLDEVAATSGSEDSAVGEMGPARKVASRYAESFDLSAASITDRVGAFLVDLGLFGVFALGVAIVLDATRLAPMPVVVLLFVLTGVVYFPVLETRYGQTIGKRLFGLCVARDDGMRPEYWRTLVRRAPLLFQVSWAPGLFSPFSAAFWIDAMVAPFTQRKQRAFDLVSRTVVVPGVISGSRAIGWAVVVLLWGIPEALLQLIAGGSLLNVLV